MWTLAEDTITESELADLAAWLLTGPRLTQGRLVREFEAEWSAWLGTTDSVMVSSGTTANLLILMAVEQRLGRKPTVGVSAVTWSTNVTPSILLGHRIHVFDVDPLTLGIRHDRAIESMRNGDIDVLFVTHLLGFNALSPDVVAAAEECGVVLLEDACESHGATMGDVKVGTFGLAASFSFYYGHHMSTIEGGMVSTSDPEFADQLRILREHGLSRASRNAQTYADRHPDIDPNFLFVSPGLNFRSSDLNAFLGMSQLASLDERIAHRNRVLASFLEALPDSIRSDYRTSGVSSFALPIVAEDASAYLGARRAIARLGVEARPVVAGNLVRQPFMQGVGITADATAAADHIHRFGAYVGNGHHVSSVAAQELAAAIREELGE